MNICAGVELSTFIHFYPHLSFSIAVKPDSRWIPVKRVTQLSKLEKEYEKKMNECWRIGARF